MALSESIENPEDEIVSRPEKTRKPSARRKRLYILYLLNDLFHHTRYHTESSLAYLTLTKSLRSSLSDLFRFVSAYNLGVFNKHNRKIDILLNIWAKNGYYSSSYLLEIKQIVEKTTNVDLGEVMEGSKDPKVSNGVKYSGTKDDAPYIMPATHGDISTPYHDLPAGNMMFYIIPNSTAPINPQLVKPLPFQAGHAKENLVKALKNFMKDADSLIKPENQNSTLVDIDDLGQANFRDKITGNLTGGESYYGWSKEFCRRLKRSYDGRESTKRLAGKNGGVEKSFSPRKRRRYSFSESRSQSRSISPSTNSAERRSPLRDDMDKRSYSRERSRSRRLQYSRSRSRSATRSNSYSPPLAPTQMQPSRIQALHPPPFPAGINRGFPLGPDGLPIPPPPPPNYKGPWPPPPPPPPTRLPTLQPNLSLSGTTYPTNSNIVPPHPPTFLSSGLPPSSHVYRNQGNQGNQRQTPTNHTSWGQ